MAIQDFSRLRKASFILAVLSIFLTTNGQTEQSIDRMITLVKKVPGKYSTIPGDKRVLDKFDPNEDVWYGTIKHYDTSAIKFLIALINDTTDAHVQNSCTREHYKIGDIAVLLINDIDPIPFATVTRTQWCVISGCGILPEGFISYVNSHRQRFQLDYKKYYYSNQRSSFIRSKTR